MHFQLYKEDIFRLIVQDEALTDYSMEQLVVDLEALIRWKNLIPIQDPGRLSTNFFLRLEKGLNNTDEIKNMSVIEDCILEKVIQSELDIPHAVLKFHESAEPNIRENVMGKWNSLKNWFIDSPENECEYKKVLKITNDVIRSIIQNAALIVQIQNWGISRSVLPGKHVEKVDGRDKKGHGSLCRKSSGIIISETYSRVQKATEKESI